MFLHFGLIFLLLANVLGLEDFDEVPIQDVNDESIKRAELSGLPIIFPGTLWCGAGNIATNKDDLGLFEETDKCCRTHDMCNDTIPGKETRHNLTNPVFYTRLNCECDMAFYNCLKAVRCISSSKIGFLYFDILGTQCFRLDYPIKRCEKKAFLSIRRCLKYQFDTNGEKRYQWFDVPNYY